jgi:glycosyltransferase involved in cell wall biosynthesis
MLMLISMPFISPYPTLLSLNRFEGKKNAVLALKAFALIRNEHSNLRLVLAGIFFYCSYISTQLTTS